MKIFIFFTLLIHSMPLVYAGRGDISFEEIQKDSTIPIVFLINGFGGTKLTMFEKPLGVTPWIQDRLEERGIPVYNLDWNDIWRTPAIRSGGDDGRLLLQMRNEVLPRIPIHRPLILVGHSFGGDSALKIARDNPNRKFALVATLDPVEFGGLRSKRTVLSNVESFYNRWTNKSTIVPFDVFKTGELNYEGTGRNDQENTNSARDFNGNLKKKDCPLFDPTCHGQYIVSLYHGGKDSIAQDEYLQREIFDKIIEIANNPVEDNTDDFSVIIPIVTNLILN
ncbi:MAG: hypothetical protein HQK51_12215 [Oligoflexia bacterium]|nr:hypothetical protein [Oligoflexia bacterium]